MSFRFEQFADAPSARMAFEAAFPAGSPAEPALQALVDMGAQCKSLGAARFACRYRETRGPLAGFAWHLALDCTSERTIKGVGIVLSMLAP
jgi:hypothetical protein